MGTAKLTFCGAARGVTGSCYHLEYEGVSVVVDCGIFQGEEAGGDADELNRTPLPFDATRVNAVVLTHGHLDHVGRLPRLGMQGFEGDVIGHPASLEIAELVMGDTARIGAFDGKPALYDDSHVDDVLSRARPIAYREPTTAGPFTIELFDAGHILGSSSVRVSWHEGAEERAVLFSGDLGVFGAPIIRDPNHDWDPERHLVDFVVMESTYGNENHPERALARAEFRNAILHAISDGGKVLIPAFAIGRTQEVLYDLNEMVESGQLQACPVIVDGRMGLSATKIYDKYRDLYDEEALALLDSGDVPLEFTGLYAAKSGQSSKQVREIDGPAIIIAGSGMCSGGRILDHLLEYLPDPRTDVIFVGYQAEGTLGRQLKDGAKEVVIHDERIKSEAVITSIDGFSAHADRDTLAGWYGKVPRKPGGAVFVTHGEEKVSRSLGRLLRDQFGARAIIPKRNDCAALVRRHG